MEITRLLKREPDAILAEAVVGDADDRVRALKRRVKRGRRAGRTSAFRAIHSGPRADKRSDDRSVGCRTIAGAARQKYRKVRIPLLGLSRYRLALERRRSRSRGSRARDGSPDR